VRPFFNREERRDWGDQRDKGEVFPYAKSVGENLCSGQLILSLIFASSKFLLK